MKRKLIARESDRQRGFTMVELVIATLVMLVGLVAVMQLVPTAIRVARDNRNETTSTVISQRLRDLMVSQPITATTLTDPTNTFPCGAGVTCDLGGGAVVGDYVAGAPLANTGLVDFSQAAIAGYNFVYTDPNDATGASYDVRWAVITSVRDVGQQTNVIVAKRIVIGARRRFANMPAVSNFVSWVSR